MLESSVTRRSFIVGGVATAAAAGFALSGCNSSSGSGSASSSGASASASGESASGSASSEAESGQAAAAKELTGVLAYSSTNINPVGNTSALMLSAGWHVFEGLYDFDLHTYKTYNALAKGDPVEISDVEYEVTLRDGALFSNGDPVTAEDVVNAFEVNMANETYSEFLSFIDAVSVVDETTVAFTLKYPFGALFKERLSIVKVFPAAQSEEELGELPIGTGPWMYVSVNGEDGGEISFSPNPNYSGMLPKADSPMRWSIMLDGAARAAALQDSEVQAAESVPDAYVDQLVDKGATVEYRQGFNQAFLMFNCQKEPFNDSRVRKAFFYAIDTEKLIANQLSGHAKLTTCFLPKGHKNYHKASTVYTYNPDKAKALLKEAGVDKLEFEMMTSNNWVKELAAQIQSDLAAVGIKMTNNETQIDWTALAPSDSNDILPFDVMLAPGDPSCFGNDPDLLMSWWYGDNVWTQGRSCWAKQEGSRFEELQALLQRGREADVSEQQDIWNACFDLIADDVPLYALFHREIATGFQSSKIEGFEPISTTGLAFLGAVAI